MSEQKKHWAEGKYLVRSSDGSTDYLVDTNTEPWSCECFWFLRDRGKTKDCRHVKYLRAFLIAAKESIKRAPADAKMKLGKRRQGATR